MVGAGDFNTESGFDFVTFQDSNNATGASLIHFILKAMNN